MNRRTRPSLIVYFFGYVVLSMVSAGLALSVLLVSDVQTFRHEASELALERRTAAAELTLGRALYANWQEVKALAQSVPYASPRALGDRLDQLAFDRKRIAWAGFAGLDGTVKESAHDLLQGADVSDMAWFIIGQNRPYAGDPYEALLLQSVLPENMEKDRFFDLAAPVSGTDGGTVGTIGLHISTLWTKELIEDIEEALDIDILILRNDGHVIIGSDVADQSEEAVFEVASTGERIAGMMVWPDNVTAFTVIEPGVVYRDLPPPSWRLATRIKPDALDAEADFEISRLFVPLGAAMAIIALLTAIFARIFLWPLLRVIEVGAERTSGEPVYPYENRATRESSLASDLSAAVKPRM